MNITLGHTLTIGETYDIFCLTKDDCGIDPMGERFIVLNNEFTDQGLCGTWWTVKIALESGRTASIGSSSCNDSGTYPVKYLGKGSVEIKYLISFP